MSLTFTLNLEMREPSQEFKKYNGNFFYRICFYHDKRKQKFQKYNWKKFI